MTDVHDVFRCLVRLRNAAEVWAGSEPDQPSHTDNEKEFDAALSAASTLIEQGPGTIETARPRCRSCGDLGLIDDTDCPDCQVVPQ